MFRFSKPETPRAALFVFLRNETRAKSGFVSYVSISLCFDFDPTHQPSTHQTQILARPISNLQRDLCLFSPRPRLVVSLHKDIQSTEQRLRCLMFTTLTPPVICSALDLNLYPRLTGKGIIRGISELPRLLVTSRRSQVAGEKRKTIHVHGQLGPVSRGKFRGIPA